MRIGEALTVGLWAIKEEFLARMESAEQEISADSIAGGGGSGSPGYAVQGGVAIVPIKGVIFQEATFLSRILSAIFGGTVLRDVVAAVQAADSDPHVKGIVFAINSPGGEAFGIEAAARVIRASAKPTRAYVDGMAASAAYWLASAADAITLSGETSQVGSIGTVLGIRDSREADRKDGVVRHEFVSSQSPKKRPDPATDEGRAHLQGYVDQLAEVFISDVARYRGVESETVKTGFGQGAMVPGSEAVTAGMADGIGTLEGALAEMEKMPATPKKMPGMTFGGSAVKSGVQVKSRGAEGGSMDERTAEQQAAEVEKARTEGHAQGKTEGHAAGKSEGVAEGRTAERVRVGAILGCEEAKGRENLARTLALETDTDPEAAKKLLAAAPQAVAEPKNPLAVAMAGVGNPKVGVASGEAGDETAEAKNIVAAYKAAQGVK